MPNLLVLDRVPSESAETVVKEMLNFLAVNRNHQDNTGYHVGS